jgi:hypothetical protein
MSQRFEYKPGFMPGDRVGPLYSHANEVLGTFEGYCKGYKSHCVVRWDDNATPARVKATTLRLVSRGGIDV